MSSNPILIPLTSNNNNTNSRISSTSLIPSPTRTLKKLIPESFLSSIPIVRSLSNTSNSSITSIPSTTILDSNSITHLNLKNVNNKNLNTINVIREEGNNSTSNDIKVNSTSTIANSKTVGVKNVVVKSIPPSLEQKDIAKIGRNKSERASLPGTARVTSSSSTGNSRNPLTRSTTTRLSSSISSPPSSNSNITTTTTIAKRKPIIPTTSTSTTEFGLVKSNKIPTSSSTTTTTTNSRKPLISNKSTTIPNSKPNVISSTLPSSSSRLSSSTTRSTALNSSIGPSTSTTTRRIPTTSISTSAPNTSSSSTFTRSKPTSTAALSRPRIATTTTGGVTKSILPITRKPISSSIPSASTSGKTLVGSSRKSITILPKTTTTTTITAGVSRVGGVESGIKLVNGIKLKKKIVEVIQEEKVIKKVKSFSKVNLKLKGQGLGITVIEPEPELKVEPEEELEILLEEIETESSNQDSFSKILAFEEVNNGNQDRRDSWETLPPSARPSLSTADAPISINSNLLKNQIPPPLLTPNLLELGITINSISTIEAVEADGVGDRSWETDLNCSQSSIVPNILSPTSVESSTPPGSRILSPLLIATQIPTQSDSSPILSNNLLPSRSELSYLSPSPPSSKSLPLQSRPLSQTSPTTTVSTTTTSTSTSLLPRLTHSRSSSLTSYSPLLSSAASTISFNSISTTPSSPSNSSIINFYSNNSGSNQRTPRPPRSKPPPPPADHFKPTSLNYSPPLLNGNNKSMSMSNFKSVYSNIDHVNGDGNGTGRGNISRSNRDSTTLEELVRQTTAKSISMSGGGSNTKGKVREADWLLNNDEGFEKEMRTSLQQEEEEEDQDEFSQQQQQLQQRQQQPRFSETNSPIINNEDEELTLSPLQKLKSRRKTLEIQQGVEIWRLKCESLELSLITEREQFAIEKSNWEAHKKSLEPDSLNEKKRSLIELSWRRATNSMEISKRSYLALADAAKAEREIVGSQLESLAVLTALMKNMV